VAVDGDQLDADAGAVAFKRELADAESTAACSTADAFVPPSRATVAADDAGPSLGKAAALAGATDGDPAVVVVDMGI
jgi:hypothetical protein